MKAELKRLGVVDMITRDLRYKRYLEEDYWPAQSWLSEDTSKDWIKRYIPTMNEYIDNYYDIVNCGVYLIKFNDIPVYVGESPKICNRLVVHCHNLFKEPMKYFAISKEEIESGRINISVEELQTGLYDDNKRKLKEKELIKEYRPILQKPETGTDICISRVDRRKVIEKTVFKFKSDVSNKQVNNSIDD